LIGTLAIELNNSTLRTNKNQKTRNCRCDRSRSPRESKKAVRKLLILAWAFVPASGCANVQLKHTTVNQASTLTKLQYQLVLENLAMMYANRSALPWHVNLTSGTAQVTDFGSAALAMGFGRQMGLLRAYSPALSAQHTIVETWGLAPATNESNLKLLQKAYHNALGSREYLSNDEEFADDLGHDLAEQAHVSLENTNYQSLFMEQTLPVAPYYGNPSRPATYTLIERNTVSSTDRCLKCELAAKPKNHEVWIEAGRADVGDSNLKARRFWFNHENNNMGP
jgi:hypothetical protein